MERAKIISAELTRLTIDVEEEFMTLVRRIRELRGNPALPLSEVFRHSMKEDIRKREPKAPRGAKSSPGNSEKPVSSEDKFSFYKSDSHADAQPENEAKDKCVDDELRRFEVGLNHSSSSVAELEPLKRSRYISARDRAATHARANGACEYVHPQAGKRCGSRFGLQMGHVIPFAKGGANTAENLLAYCPAHNQLSAAVADGIKKMNGFYRARD
ncbi:MAG: HNH endonuclease [Cryobacterium sp.]|nr:HNH endonuclease [Oligoflexia bacterium]